MQILRIIRKLLWIIKGKEFKYIFLNLIMKKVGVLMLVLILTLMIVSAQNETIDEKASSCLQNNVKDKCDKLTLEQQVFTLLSLSDNSGIQSECKSSLLDKKKTDNSFGTIKDTALSAIALNYVGTSTKEQEKWILAENKSASLEWYLEIESNSETKCTVDSSSITIKQDKKISGNAGSCLSLAYNNYWLRISDNCLNKNFIISCDKYFISTLIYKKPGSNVWHVSSDAQTSSPGGKTEHQIKSSCFGASGCDYESSLWAALALSRTGNRISGFLPYLITYSEDNKNLFPETFLYILTGSAEYLNQISLHQKNDGSWKQGNNEYYDTALAILSLYGQDELISNALAWLETKQNKDGCWNNGNIRDTGFLLWAAFPATPIAISQGISRHNCEPDYYCINTGQCDEVKGKVLDNFYCSGFKICCDSPALERKCSDLRGVICSAGQICSSGTTTRDSEGKDCCLTSCRDEKPECEQYSNQTCKSTCSENEESIPSYGCFGAKICCKSKPVSEKSYLWIYLLVILIILVIIAIILRKRLRLFLFKLKSRFEKGPVTKTRPDFPPAGPPQFRRMFPTRMLKLPQRPKPIFIGRNIRKTGAKVDKELEETMRKLKEMSK